MFSSIFDTEHAERYRKSREYLKEKWYEPKDLYCSDDAGDGTGFDEVLPYFKVYKPIRNLNWAPGVYVVLNKDNRTVTMYYEDKDSPTLDHSNEMECIGIEDLISLSWVVVYQCRQEF